MSGNNTLTESGLPHLPSLPTEIWHGIAVCSSNHDQRSLLGVSRLHREVARDVLFRTVELFFGLWEVLKHGPGTIPEDTTEEALKKRTSARSKQLLSKIAEDSQFALLVKELRILCYTNDGMEVEDTRLLDAAIRALPHLQGFLWFGTFPHMTLQAAQTLSASCPQLRILRIPASQLTKNVPQALQLRLLESLMFCCQLHIDNVEGYNADDIAACKDEMEKLIHDNRHITSLTIYSALLEHIKLGELERLAELDVWAPRDGFLLNLDKLVPYGYGLKSLSLVELTDCNIVLPMLFLNGLTFPNLSALKIMSLKHTNNPRGIDALTSFLRSHRKLRRLDLDLPGADPHDLMDFLDAVSDLELDSFGCDLRSLTDLGDLERISSCLPLTLVALHIEFCWEIDFSADPLMQPFVDRLIDMPCLELLHIQTAYSTAQTFAEDLAFALAKIKIIGLAEEFFTVTRPGNGNEGVVLDNWSFKNVALRTPANVGTEGEWLLRFHDLLEALPVRE